MSIFNLPWCDFFMAFCGCITLTLLLVKDVHCKSVIKIRWYKYLLFAAVFTILLNFLFSLSCVESLKLFSGIYCIKLFLLFWNIQQQIDVEKMLEKRKQAELNSAGEPQKEQMF
jgi:hypothetical protein